MLWYDMLLNDIVWFDMVWYDTIWADMIWFDTIQWATRTDHWEMDPCNNEFSDFETSILAHWVSFSTVMFVH